MPALRPPPGTLAFAEQTQRGGWGSYCWFVAPVATPPNTRQAQPGGCIDMLGIPAPEETLLVAPGALLAFAFEGTTPLTEIIASAYPLAGQQLSVAGGQRWLPWAQVTAPPGTTTTIHGVELPTALSGQGATITAAVPVGEYAILVRLHTQGGDASYGFHVTVHQ